MKAFYQQYMNPYGEKKNSRTDIYHYSEIKNTKFSVPTICLRILAA